MSGFSDSEKIDLLIKKFFGKPSTNTSIQFYQEAGLNARPSIFQDQIYTDTIPATAPNDIKDLGSGDNDDDGDSLGGSVKGKTSSSDTMVRKYVKVQLVKITNGLNSAFKGPANGGDANILQNAVPFNFDDDTGTYNYTLYDKNDDQIPFGTGDWVIDPDSGHITFYEYDDVSSVIDENNPPTLTYYRYVGTTGMSSGLWTDSTNEIYYNNKTVVIDATSRTADYALEVRGTRDVKIHKNLIAQDVTSVSDKTLKKNIRKLKYGLKEIKKINPVLFDWVEENNAKDNMGLIAQELEEVIPELVYKDKYTGLCSIKYDKLTMILINGIKDLSTKYNKLIRKVNKQDKIIKSLDERLVILENNNESEKKN